MTAPNTPAPPSSECEKDYEAMLDAILPDVANMTDEEVRALLKLSWPPCDECGRRPARWHHMASGTNKCVAHAPGLSGAGWMDRLHHFVPPSSATEGCGCTPLERTTGQCLHISQELAAQRNAPPPAPPEAWSPDSQFAIATPPPRGGSGEWVCPTCRDPFCGSPDHLLGKDPPAAAPAELVDELRSLGYSDPVKTAQNIEQGLREANAGEGKFMTFAEHAPGQEEKGGDANCQPDQPVDVELAEGNSSPTPSTSAQPASSNAGRSDPTPPPSQPARDGEECDGLQAEANLGDRIYLGAWGEVRRLVAHLKHAYNIRERKEQEELAWLLYDSVRAAFRAGASRRASQPEGERVTLCRINHPPTGSTSWRVCDHPHDSKRLGPYWEFAVATLTPKVIDTPAPPSSATEPDPKTVEAMSAYGWGIHTPPPQAEERWRVHVHADHPKGFDLCNWSAHSDHPDQFEVVPKRLLDAAKGHIAMLLEIAPLGSISREALEWLKKVKP